MLKYLQVTGGNMGFNRLPSHSEKLLLEIVNVDNPSQLLCNRFEQASSKEDDELRGIIRELRQEGYINVKWADNIPYFVTLNNSARTYKEQLAEYKSQIVIKETKDKKVRNIIFISHRSTDKAIADMLVDFFSSTGIPKEIIFCSSLPGNDINEKISGEVKTALRNSAVNIAILSHDYYESAYCLNEAGIVWYENVPVIPIALPEVNSSNMYGFLNNEYKLRRLDSDTDISYIYDTVNEALSVPQVKASVITYENNKLRARYADYIKTRETPNKITAVLHSDAISEITTDDERIVLYYILRKNIRKVSKSTICEWLNKNEIYEVNVDNAFDLLSCFEGGTIINDTLEFGIDTFRRYSANSSAILPSLKECVDRHIKLASDTFKTIWKDNIVDSTLGLFIAYIVDERMCLFGNRWMAEAQIENIKNWESKYELDSTLSDNYGSCLEFFIQNNFVFESSWTSYGNPREYSLCPSLKELLFNHAETYRLALEECKESHHFVFPF